MKITIDLGRAPWAMYQRVAAFTFHSLQAHYPDLAALSVEVDRGNTLWEQPDAGPFDIPAHDMATGQDVDDTNGDPVAPPPPPVGADIDPMAEVKARVQASIKRLVAALGGEAVTLELPACDDPNCPFCSMAKRASAASLGLNGARQVPTESIGAPGSVDANGNIVSHTPGTAYASGSVYIGVDELERAELAGWRPWLGVVGSKVVGVRR